MNVVEKIGLCDKCLKKATHIQVKVVFVWVGWKFLCDKHKLEITGKWF
jgi:hypothetical protein